MSLKAIVAEKILDSVIRGVKTNETWKALVVDHSAMRVISSCCKMHEIMAEGVTIVEDLHKGRQPLPLEAIYFVSPTEKSIDCMLEDFKDPPSFRYKAAHIFFTEACPAKLFDKIASPQSHLGRHIKTLKEINISFLPVEAQVFSLDYVDAFNNLYSEKSESEDRTGTVERIAEQLATLCATLGEYPLIRYRSASPLTLDISQALLRKLDAYKADNMAMGDGPLKQKSQILILDRGYDTVTPLLHDLTYQAMGYDLLNIQNDVYKYDTNSGGGDITQQEVLLDENDDLWVKLRHRHIAQVSQDVTQQIKDFQGSKRILGKEKDKTGIRDLSILMKRMPQYQKELRKYSIHLNLAEDCLRVYNRDNIEQLCSVEQDLATGVDKEGQKIKDPMRIIFPILLDKGITEANKVRMILLLAVVMQGLSEENMGKLMDHAKISGIQKSTILNMARLGVPVVQDYGKSKPQPVRKERPDEGYQLSRYVPYIKDIMEDAVDGKLDSKLYPFLFTRESAGLGASGTHSARSARHGNWHNKDKGQSEAKSCSRLIIFVVGGPCYSEMRCAYEVTQALKDANKPWEVIIGGTELSTPNILLYRLRGIS